MANARPVNMPKKLLGDADRAIVTRTLPAVKSRMLLITTKFYQLIFNGLPEAKYLFNMSHHTATKGFETTGHSQPRAIANALICIATHLEQILDLLDTTEGQLMLNGIVNKHVACQLDPRLYAPVGAYFLGAIESILGPSLATAEVLGAWEAFYFFCADMLIDMEVELVNELEHLPGGWRGGRNFTITDKVVETPDTESDHEDKNRKWLSLTLTSEDGLPVICARAGQYITLVIKDEEKGINTTRHYSISDLVHPGGNTYRITLNVINEGLISNYLLNHKEVGDRIVLCPPLGAFGLNPNMRKNHLNKVDEIAAQHGIVFTPEMLDVEYINHPLTAPPLRADGVGAMEPMASKNDCHSPSAATPRAMQRHQRTGSMYSSHMSTGSHTYKRRPMVILNYPGTILPPREIIEQERIIIRQPRNPKGGRRPSTRRPSIAPPSRLSSHGDEELEEDESEMAPIKVLLIGYNAGVTPMISMMKEIIAYEQKLEYLSQQGIEHGMRHINVTFLHFVKQSQNFILKAELEALEDHHPFINIVPIFYHIYPIIEFASPTPFFFQLCRYYSMDVESENCYIIGSQNFLKAINYTLGGECGFNTDHINWEFFGPRYNMKHSEVI